MLQWTAPASPGGTLPLYDTVRSVTAAGFSGGSCVETRDGSDATSTDPAVPAAAFFYLVRAENSCGVGSAGRTSSNVERTVASCP